MNMTEAADTSDTIESPWDAVGQPPAEDAAGAAWLGAPQSEAAGSAAFEWHAGALWDGSLPVQAWINETLAWFVAHFRPLFQMLREPIDAALNWVEALLLGAPVMAMGGVFCLLAWQFAGGWVAFGTLASLLVVLALGIWPEAMVTLSLVLTSLAFCLILGLPAGVWMAYSQRAERVVRPLLDIMQTAPAFVYLVPVVMLFGIGNVPGVIVTIVFSVVPLVRLTSLGIRQVRPDLIEAARAYGASPWQMLTRLQLPLAMPSIMAGVNQTLMMSLSMVVIASMIAVGGLGQMVLRGIGRLDMGQAMVGGLGIVLLAIALDRITQGMGRQRAGAQAWWRGGPVGFVVRLVLRLWGKGRGAPGAGRAQVCHGPAKEMPS